MPQNKNQLPAVNGFLNFYKPIGVTSMEALRRVKRITEQRQKVGHAGTMDPLARGVLPVCFGQATRLMDYLVAGGKRYVMEMKLGAATSTYDAEGEVTREGDFSHVTRDMVEAALPRFIGLVQQTPPMYSAVKVQGQRLYKLARQGMEVERQPRQVEIHNIRLSRFEPPLLTLDVECGRGVYMRSLAHDLGELLECGAHVADLERLQVGEFKAEDSVTLETLEQANESNPDGWQRYLYAVDWALRELKGVVVGAQAERYLKNGQAVTLGQAPPRAGYLEQFRVYSSDGRFLALARFDRAVNSCQPVKVFELAAPSPFAPATPLA